MESLVADPFGGPPLTYVLPDEWESIELSAEISIGLLHKLQGRALPDDAGGPYMAGWITADDALFNHTAHKVFIQ
jgi:hypothetical protein